MALASWSAKSILGSTDAVQRIVDVRGVNDRVVSGRYCCSSSSIVLRKQHKNNGVAKHGSKRPKKRSGLLLLRAPTGIGSSLSDGLDVAPTQAVDPVDLPQGMSLAMPASESDIMPQAVVGGFSAANYSIDESNIANIAGGAAEVMAASVSMYQPRWIWFATSEEEEIKFLDRAINATIAGSLGVFCLTKIVTVDHDYWHGWTMFEILKYAPVHNWQGYEEMLKSHPVLAKMMISGTVYSLGDWIAQCYEGKPFLEFNRLRMFRSGLVGFCLHGSMSHFYYHFCEWLFPFNDWWAVPLKVAFDQTIWSGFWNSVYFVTLGLLRLESPTTIGSELRETFFKLLSAGWKLWPFAHVITYGLIPVEQRLLWVDMVEIVWVTILSMLSNQKAEERISEAAATEAIASEDILYVVVDDVESSSDKVS